MKRFRQLPFGLQLLCLSLVPLIGLLISASLTLKGSFDKKTVSALQLDMIRLSVQSTALVHELQKERGMSAGFVGSEGKQLNAELLDQRKLTDAAIKPLLINLQRMQAIGTVPEQIDQAEVSSMLQAIQEKLRAEIDSFTVTVGSAVSSYTVVNTYLMDMSSRVLISDEGKAYPVAAYTSFLKRKERAAIEWAILADTFTRDSFVPGNYTKLLNLIAEQRAYLDDFLAFSTIHNRQAYEAIAGLPAFIEAQRLRDTAMEKAAIGGFGVDPVAWFDVQTEKFNHLKVMQDDLSEQLKSQAILSSENANAAIGRTIGGIAITVGASLLFTLLVQRTIQGQLGAAPAQIGRIARAVSSGKLDTDFSAYTTGTDSVVSAMALMQRDLLSSGDKEKHIANENSDIRSALEAASSNLMLASSDHKIIYMNRSMKVFLREFENDFKASVSDFSANSAMGGHLSQFGSRHLQPGYLNALSGSDTVDISYGNRHFRLIVAPVIDSAGEKAGVVVEWSDRTQMTQAETEIQQIVQSAQRGDLDQRISLQNKYDFFMSLSESVNRLMQVCGLAIQETSHSVSAISEGNLTRRMTGSFDGKFAVLQQGVNDTIDKLTEVVTDINQTSSQVSKDATEIATGSAELSERTEKQARRLDKTSKMTKSIAATAQANARSATDANNLVEQARQRATQGGEVIESAINAMSAISESSDKVTNIIAVIDDIAFQTNLLALNASIEAARAGEQGRGFAVVASEVRDLAGRSSQAANEIKALIEDSVSKVDDGSRLVGESGKTLQSIVDSVDNVSSMVSTIVSASTDQKRDMQEIELLIEQLDAMNKENANLLDETATASNSMSDEANALSSLVGYFQTVNADAAHGNTEKKAA